MENTKLIHIRKSKKISQTDIATYLKISQTQYQKRETGKIKISDYEWDKIARLLDVDVNEIYTSDHNSNLLEELLFLKQRIRKLEQRIKNIDLWKKPV
ncbi:helix-turn-helix transcriptional regulator [Chryseobacterium sp. SSA4.19]|uniref:helix-turn-helix domain-containing protein n=1 Tax=Chryseobacterium sp. SSA4.19 TaxID=2919915 RepID=UPI001F4E5E72|nr:helix-turn-helix transcriptional regulator [Chryseobacterium sp. SSA4.19]MCJ8152967.1 helix-turn-helix transcriptional regulator [Chryseobacterium sp. SSA4.19]